MKKKNFHIAIAFFLLANLFFTQITAGFLHDEHCERDEITHHDSENGGLQLNESHEECFICSLDFYHELFVQENVDVFVQAEYKKAENALIIQDTQSSEISSSGRSPPSC